MKKYLNLPRKKDGKPYLSYSAYTSFKNKHETEFYYQAILDYIFGVKTEGRFTPFAKYGSDIGDFINPDDEDKNGLLSVEDKKLLTDFKEGFSDKCLYEKEIWLDLGDFYCLGYSDRFEEDKDGVVIEDFKSGNKDKKISFYGDEDRYNQTILYAYPEDLAGKKIKDCYVTLFGRKGNPIHMTKPTKMYLDGTITKISTPYSRKRAEKVIKDMKKIAVEVSSLKTTADKLKELTIKF